MTLHEAKRRLLGNVGTNIAAVVVNIIIGIGLTPYFINKLGVAVYGMIPLVVSFIAYFNILTMSLVNSISRFVALNFNRGDIQKSCVYFNTSLFTAIFLNAVLLLPLCFVSYHFDSIFKVPPGFEVDSSWFFFLVMVSCGINLLTSPFSVSTFVRHRFDLLNISNIMSRLVRIGVLVMLFIWVRPSLLFVGVSYVAMAVLHLSFCLLYSRVLTPELRVNAKEFDWLALREMGAMSTWVAVNQIGSLLYVSVSFVVVNVFLGAEQCGRYGPIVTLTVALGSLAAALSNFFAPVALQYIAQDELDSLDVQMRRTIRLLGVIMALPVGLLCGLSKPLLTRWLGSGFAEYYGLVWLMIGPWLLIVSIRPVFHVFSGMNRVKVPALVTLGFGIANVMLSICLVKFTSLGLYGIAISLLICLCGKNFCFTPTYASLIMKQPLMQLQKQTVPGICVAAIVAGLATFCSLHWDLATIPRLLSCSALLALVYCGSAYGLFLTKGDKAFIMSLVLRRKRST